MKLSNHGKNKQRGITLLEVLLSLSIIAIILVVKVYKYSDCVLIRETLGMECAFWAQIPGEARLISALTAKREGGIRLR